MTEKLKFVYPVYDTYFIVIYGSTVPLSYQAPLFTLKPRFNAAFYLHYISITCSYTKDAKAKRKTALSFESDPDINMYAACWASKNIYSLHKGWFVNLSARLVSIDLAHNDLEELPEELFNILPVLEELDVSHNKLIFLPEINHTNSFTR